MRFVLILFNAGLVTFGILLILQGCKYDQHLKVLEDYDEPFDLDALFMCAGSALLLTSFIGIIASVVDYKWSFITYGTVLVTSICIQFISSIIIFLSSLHINSYVSITLVHNFVDFYERNFTNYSHYVNKIQENWLCCSVNAVDPDIFEQNIPRSCCYNKRKLSTPNECELQKINKITCEVAAANLIRKPMSFMRILSTLFALIEFFVALWAFYKGQKNTSKKINK